MTWFRYDFLIKNFPLIFIYLILFLFIAKRISTFLELTELSLYHSSNWSIEK